VKQVSVENQEEYSIDIQTKKQEQGKKFYFCSRFEKHSNVSSVV
jgi:hypothetical protein